MGTWTAEIERSCMEQLEEKVHELFVTCKNKSPCPLLQEINALLLARYMIRIENRSFYPIEVEAYFYDKEAFPDTYVHRNELQQGRFGKLYFHRKSRNKKGRFSRNRGGVDICLSDNDRSYYSLLIRGIRIDAGTTICSSPNKVARCLLGETSDIQRRVTELEQQACLVRSENDPRLNQLIIHTQRYGLTTDMSPDFARYNLRTLTEFGTQFPYNKYKGKEEIAFSYFSSLNRSIRKEEIRDLLGYVPQRFLELFNVI